MLCFLFNPQKYSKTRHGFRMGWKKVLSNVLLFGGILSHQYQASNLPLLGREVKVMAY